MARWLISPNSKRPVKKTEDLIKPRSLLLTIDVGNTSASFALYPAKKTPRPKPLKFWREETPTLLAPRERTKAKKKILRRLGQTPVAGIYVSSVVPEAQSFLRSLGSALRSPLRLINASNAGKLKVRYKKPKEVGSDRLANARGALALSKGPLIVMDFGTATTFDCVSAQNAYLGGVITPGPAISAQALFVKTAKLPEVYLSKPAKILGQNTRESIESGLYHGARGMAREITALLRKKLGSKTTVFVTGGQAPWLIKGLPGKPRFVPDLTHLGLYWIWRDRQN